jgi:succinyl-CoA synthetase beta subunit
MILLEYEAKGILAKYDIPVPSAELVNGSPLFPFPLIIKSQVPVGGRGKAGGIRVVKNQDEFNRAKTALFSLEINGFTPKNLLAEELLKIDREMYLAIRVNSARKTIELVAHPNGGIDVEENAHDGFYTTNLSDPKSFSVVAESLAELYDLPDKVNVIEELIKNLFRCFVENDALLLEVNPLVLTKQSQLVAADCKLELDSSAAFRHPEWNFETKSANTNFVTLNHNGTVATIANGAGLAMATVDAVAAGGLAPANFLDIGGGANEASVLRAFNEIMNYPNIRAIVINIFAGITRCDEVAKAIIAARKQIKNLPPLCIRLAGTNLPKAKSLLEAEGVALLPSLEACTSLAKEYES